MRRLMQMVREKISRLQARVLPPTLCENKDGREDLELERILKRLGRK